MGTPQLMGSRAITPIVNRNKMTDPDTLEEIKSNLQKSTVATSVKLAMIAEQTKSVDIEGMQILTGGDDDKGTDGDDDENNIDFDIGSVKGMDNLLKTLNIN